jgi:hypothetical protein
MIEMWSSFKTSPLPRNKKVERWACDITTALKETFVFFETSE